MFDEFNADGRVQSRNNVIFNQDLIHVFVDLSLCLELIHLLGILLHLQLHGILKEVLVLVEDCARNVFVKDRIFNLSLQI